jgi:hypothetical protein
MGKLASGRGNLFILLSNSYAVDKILISAEYLCLFDGQ